MLRLYDQTVLSDHSRGQYGDCLRACVRTLAQAPMLDLPHPVGPDGKMNPKFFDAIAGYGPSLLFRLWRLERDFSDLPRLVIATGMSPRSKGDTTKGHAVVMDRAEGRVVHDPHSSRAGLVAYYGYYWLAWTDG